MNRAYDHIVSLGYDCRLAYNLRETFGPLSKYPFDWWITPLSGLLAFLKRGPDEHVVDPALLAPVYQNGKPAHVRNIRYGIHLVHAFPRPGGRLSPDWREHLDEVRSKADYLWRRFTNLKSKSGRVLFVRVVHSSDVAAGENVGAQVVELLDVLERLFPGLDFDLLLIDAPEPVAHPRVINLEIRDEEGGDWRGKPQLWTKRFHKRNISWTGARHKQMEARAPAAAGAEG